MRFRMLFRIICGLAICTAVISSTLYFQLVSQQVPFDGADGSAWLKWSEKTRELYVTAYVHGLMRGYSRGCEAGIRSTTPTIDSARLPIASDKCWTSFPISTQDSIKLIGSITQFYKEYPDQRSIHASDVLLALHEGRSIQQIHDQPPPDKGTHSTI
jgi:hypothetical protein